MAIFRIEATPDTDITDYKFRIHDMKVDMKDGVGCIDLDWITCGSGSNFVDYTLEGRVGAALSFRIFCGTNLVHEKRRTKQSSDSESFNERFDN